MSAPHAAGEPRPATAAWRFASGLFFLAALTVGGGALGLTVGVLLDKALRRHAHGFSGLLGLLLGTPAGALLGFGGSLLWLGRLAPDQRLRRGALALGVAGTCGLGLLGAVQLGLMRW